MKTLQLLILLLLSTSYCVAQYVPIEYVDKDQVVTTDQSQAVTYRMYAELRDNKGWEVKEYKMDGTLLTSGVYADKERNVRDGASKKNAPLSSQRKTTRN